MSSLDRSFSKILLAAFLLQVSTTCYCQKGQLIRDSIVSKSLANTLTGENAVRQVAVYLPPGYNTSTKRFPVLYLLHGIGDDQETFTGDTTRYNNIQDLMNAGIAAKKFGEMIIVMPNEKTNWFGSFYSNSTATGNWANFTAIELVRYIDSKYRTIPNENSRAVAGHSMGGYGAITLAMTYPEVFSVTYGMNSAFICFCGEIKPSNPDIVKFVKSTSYEDLLETKSLIAIGMLTVSQAFSPNTNNPPFYADKPYKMVGTKLIPDTNTYNKWIANNPVQMAERFKSNLAKLKAIKFDSGSEDEFLFIVENNRLFSKKLTTLKIPHQFEEYNGDHRNRLWGLRGRIYNDMIPFVFENTVH
ncbi:MAG: esterase family protein [Flammeovirgaceae bacterium]|nr:MAG: esterase family protein [Flammeovirgaceae bacterium]